MNTGNPVLPERKSEFAIQMKKWAASLVAGDELRRWRSRSAGSRSGTEGRGERG